MNQSHEPRVVGGHTLHDKHEPEKCPRTSSDPKIRNETCGVARVVDCCKQTPDRDVEECSKCGKQRSAPCSFDEDYS